MKKVIVAVLLGLVWCNTVSSSKSEGLTNTSRCNIDYLVKLIEIIIEGKPEWKLVVNKKCKIYLANYEELKNNK
jgi:hypothetical protein